ncbi:hypothetical protein F5B22DRAFT_516492 [Xylaria bambusicola]|uniref:uncharacterized protein n=1 Tax=Xylaria bambusicola TaxID=326684 RepID=UPI00200826EA|nr:uncharacterized protein F5B22DRAFT_516492 [Xylaria bambusicola]KAI0505636.1 hypothetical protein F5B22DRAFT_516492 [Xylaria bambusicola]
MAVEGLDGCTWTIPPDTLSPGAAAGLSWQHQITTPMSLEALHDIIGKARAKYLAPPVSLLTETNHRVQGLVYVSTEFFQSSPEALPTTPTSDILGSFSLGLSYAKAADRYISGTSPKFRLPITLRNDFQSRFNLIKGGLGSSLDNGASALYSIVKTLACYRWYTDDDMYQLEIDQLYRNGDLANLIIGTKRDELKYSLTGGKINPPPSFTIKEWTNDLQANKGTECLPAIRRAMVRSAALGTEWSMPLVQLGWYPCSSSETWVVAWHHNSQLLSRWPKLILSIIITYGNAPATTISRRTHRSVQRQLTARSANVISVTMS